MLPKGRQEAPEIYTKKQNEEIKKVCQVFQKYIKENPYFDIVWSEKLGYVYLGGISPDKEEVAFHPMVLRTGSELCKDILMQMALDALKKWEFTTMLLRNVR